MSTESNRQFNIFLNPAEIQSLDSMEGVPVYDPAAVKTLQVRQVSTSSLWLDVKLNKRLS